MENYILSLVRVVNNEGNRITQKRLADINNNELVQINNEKTLEDNNWNKNWNINTIISNEGSKVLYDVMIVKWTVTPSLSDPEKPYYITNFVPEMTPIEIIELSSLNRINEIDKLIYLLKSGVSLGEKKGITCDLVIFAYKKNEEEFEGILFDRNDLTIQDEKLKIKDDVTKALKYTFTKNDIYYTKTQSFYRYLVLPKEDELLYLKDKDEIIRNTIENAINWNAAKKSDYSKKEWKRTRDLLDLIQKRSVYEELADKLGCSIDKAESYVKDYLEKADKITICDDVVSNLLKLIISNDETLLKKCEIIVREDWGESHKKELEDANKETNIIKSEIKALEDKKNSLKNEITDYSEKLSILQNEIVEKEKLGDSVSLKVSKKIEAARQDATNFISEMAFMYGINSTIIPKNGCDENEVIIGKCSELNNVIKQGMIIDDEKIEEYTKYADLLNEISEELKVAGVEKESIEFAGFLYASYLNNISLLLCGPNGEEIANAFSAACFGRLAAVFDCNQSFSFQKLEQVLNDTNEVLIIKNPFNNVWSNYIADFVTKKNAFCILINPYVEDIIIEPNGLYNYVLPFFTETIVDKMASPANEFWGGKKSKDFLEYKGAKSEKEDRTYNSLLKDLNVSNLLNYRINNLIYYMHDLTKIADKSKDYLYILFPYAYAIGKGNILADEINNNDIISDDIKEYILKFIGAYDE